MTSQDEVERCLLSIMAEILGQKSIGKTDDLFSLGITSLSTALLVMRVMKEFGAMLSISNLLENPTIEGLAKVIVDHPGPRRPSPASP